MELHERLSAARPTTGPAGTADQFAELKTRIHLAVIGDLGPQLYNVSTDPVELRDRVLSDIREQLTEESDIARDDKLRLEEEIADDILGHGPLERLLADDSITEIMVNGAYEIWIERAGRISQTGVRFNDEQHLRRIINKMVAQVGRRIDESSPMVDARLPDGSRVNAVIPPLSLSGPLVTIRKFSRKRLKGPDDDRFTDALDRDGGVPRARRRGAAQHSHLRRHGRRQDDAAQRPVGGDPGQRADRHHRGCRRASARPASRAAARGPAEELEGEGESRSATSSATPCACVPIASSSARSAAPRRSTCSRR